MYNQTAIVDQEINPADHGYFTEHRWKIILDLSKQCRSGETVISCTRELEKMTAAAPSAASMGFEQHCIVCTSEYGA